MAFINKRRVTTYRVKCMSRYQFQEVLHQSRYEKIRIDNMGRDHIAFVSGLMYQYHSSRDTTQKLDIMCLLWIYVAKIHKTPFCEDKWEDGEDDDYSRSYQILESFGHALRCGGVIRDRRFMDVFRNIETQISRLGYYPYYAVKEKIKELNGVYRTRLKYFLNMHTQKFLDVSDKKRVMNGEFDSFCGYSDYTPNYELARLVSFGNTDCFNVERFDKIKHLKLKTFWGSAKMCRLEDSLAEYWVSKEETDVFAYADVFRKRKTSSTNSTDKEYHFHKTDGDIDFFECPHCGHRIGETFKGKLKENVELETEMGRTQYEVKSRCKNCLGRIKWSVCVSKDEEE